MSTMLIAAINQKADDQKKEEDTFSLDDVQGTVKLQKATVIPPLSTSTVMAWGTPRGFMVMMEDRVPLLGGKVTNRRGKLY